MAFDCAQERTCGFASGATTRTRPPASMSLAILDSATIPAPTTRHGRAESLRNMGKSFEGFMFARGALLARAQASSLKQIRPVVVPRVKTSVRSIPITRGDRESGERSFRGRDDNSPAG